MIHFILNDKDISIDSEPTKRVLDFLRKKQHLVGSQESCRTGDCGSCAILIGTKSGKYKVVNSCLFPMLHLQGKHVVTIEGLNKKTFSPIQKALIEENAIQCGYCIPGIVVALTSFFTSITCSEIDSQNAIDILDGNICRCTGYQSIKRAIIKLCKNLSAKKQIKPHVDIIKWLVEEEILPGYFLEIKQRLQKLPIENTCTLSGSIILAGGTELMNSAIPAKNIINISSKKELETIEIKEKHCYIGAAVTIDMFSNSVTIAKYFPNVHSYCKLIASTPIRNISMVVGNIVGAAPTADLAVFFLALNSSVHLKNKSIIPLKDFFLGEKKVKKSLYEIVEFLSFPLPNQNTFFNFEKVSKRLHLDIASVNSAIQITVVNGIVKKNSISAGGVASKPLLLKKTMDYFTNKKITSELLKEGGKIAQLEISPITDIRGSSQYKLLLMRQLIYAHFIKLFPFQIEVEKLQ